MLYLIFSQKDTYYVKKKENRKGTADPTIFSLLSLEKQVKQRELSLR